MMGMIRLTPEESVRWYLPSRSMIIVWACCTIRMPRATIEIANSTIAAGTISAPMLSMLPAPSALLVHVQRRPFHPHDHHPRPRLERGIHQRRGAPVLALDHHPPLARARVDALRHDADSAREGVDAGSDLAPAGMEVLQQERTNADERSEERRVGKECRSRWSPYH